MKIRRAKPADAPAVVAIYNRYVLATTVSFETAPITPEEMVARMARAQTRHDWLVGQLESGMAGFAYYGPFRHRPAYDHTAESAIYLADSFHGQGYGGRLYEALIASAQAKGIRQLIGIIALPNEQSISLHRRLGFRQVGLLTGVGHKFDQDVDVAVWQLALA